MSKFVEAAIIAVMVLVVVALFGAAGAFVFMQLWNYVAPALWANAPHLSFLQAWALLVILGVVRHCFRSPSPAKA